MWVQQDIVHSTSRGHSYRAQNGETAQNGLPSCTETVVVAIKPNLEWPRKRTVRWRIDLKTSIDMEAFLFHTFSAISLHQSSTESPLGGCL